MINLKNYSVSSLKDETLSGILVAIALVPEAIAFSFVAGVSPIVGLYTAFILGLVVSILGGKAGMISGATGAVAVVFVGLGVKVNEIYGGTMSMANLSEIVLAHILLATILAGAFQIIIGVLKLGKFIRLVPQPAMFGFVNGLAIVIATAQFKFFEVFDKFPTENITWMYILAGITMAIMFLLPKITKAVPAGLVAIVAITIFVYFVGIDTKTVGHLADIQGDLPTFSLPSLAISWDTIILILPYAVLVALVGLIESLLTLSVLDEMSGKRGSGNKECIAQGVGNMTCGVFGGMAGCAMIGQSIINFSSGGLGRLSSSVAAILLIVFVVSLSGLIAIIPVAVLVGIMFMVSIGTFEFSSLGRIKYMPKSDAFVLIIVTVITVLFDLAIAVITGIIISALVFAWKHAFITSRSRIESDGTKVYELDGPLFFASVTSFSDQFDINEDPKNVVLDFKNTRVMDISGVEAIDAITQKYTDMGKKLSLRHLSKDCKNVLKNAGPFCSYEEDDPTYKVAVNY